MMDQGSAEPGLFLICLEVVHCDTQTEVGNERSSRPDTWLVA